MRILTQSLSTGSIDLLDIPCPSPSRGQLLIRSTLSLVSAGTERMLLDFGKSNYLDKARQQPEKVSQALDKARTEGLFTTIDSIRTKLDEPLLLGYCNVGEVVAIGEGVTGFSVGDRVASNGNHAELVTVSQNLCAHIPPSVSDEAAAFTVLGSIGLQGIRLANPTLGETFVVSGLGLIGLLTAQLLVSQGVRVLGLDPDLSKCQLAESLGITAHHLTSSSDPVAWCLSQTNSIGVDGVIITAATKSTQPVNTAAEVCRCRGRIVLVGVTGLELRRDLFYKKELSFQVSCSYGPGRYDPNYELRCNDYPIGYVRWTEQRNFVAVLQVLANSNFNTRDLITHTFDFDQAAAAYELLLSNNPYLGILLRYPQAIDHSQKSISLNASPLPSTQISSSGASEIPFVSVIGAGNYARRSLLPAFSSAGARFHTICAPSGLNPTRAGHKFGFLRATTDLSSLFDDLNCKAVVIASRHDSHADLVIKALASGKHVFVEKPLCLTSNELNLIENGYSGDRLLMVGFNRRFSPLVLDLKAYLKSLQGPKAFVYTCNAGAIPSEHWTQDPAIGGGRLLGEACHFVDLLRFLAASPIDDLQLVTALDNKPCPDTFSLNLRFVDGSIGTIHYFASGNKAFPKERLEVFSSGKVFQLDNYRKLKAWGLPGFRRRSLFTQDKGQSACCSAFLDAIANGNPSPIPPSEIFEVQRWLLKSVTS